MNQFRLLMWKHYHLRTHRWFMSLVEILLPIFIAYLLCCKGGAILTEPSKDHEAIIKPFHKIEDFFKTSGDLKFVYAPKNEFTEKMMKTVANITGVKNLVPVGDEQELETFITKNTNDSFNGHWMGIVFLKVVDKTNTTSKLSYKIRATGESNTDALYFESNDPKPHFDDSYIESGYAGVQIALDTAYIQTFKSDFSYQKILFQPFPYPEFKTMNTFRLYAPQIVYYVVLLTSLVLAVPLISAIIEEKETGVKELMKISGMKEWILELSWFVNAVIFSLFSFTIVTYFLRTNFQGSGSAVLLYVPAWIVWICIMLYCISNIAFCFTFSAIFRNLTVASSVFNLVFYILGYATIKVDSLNSLFLTKLICLCPMGAFYQAFQRIIFFENHQQAVTWSSHKPGEISLLFALEMLVLDTIVYFLLAYYISAINPGTYGTKKSPFFFIEKLWSSPKMHSSDGFKLLETNEENDKYFEKPPQNLRIGLHIENLHMNFGSVYAVRGVNLNVYRGEITALLGHNGAGKTTTMGILTGMIKATKGSVTNYENFNVLEQMDEFRKKLGLCPQEDRLFSYLSVRNHLLFYGMLRGASKQDALNEANEYLHLLEMTSKANSLSNGLSGGMKRKLCLAIALMGKVDTLILDEPTSGMDVESRRKLWDLLLDMRGNRTIILSTHHMEEADALGDRIAIMNHGVIVSHGTSLFLKKSFDTGYEVTISKNRDNEAILTEIIENVIPQASKVHESNNEIVYKLPLTETAKFPELFNTLETQKEDLGIKNIGVACTTMEQVFLKVGELSLAGADDSTGTVEVDRTASTEDLVHEFSTRKKTGLSLVVQQLGALFLKKYIFMKGNISKLLLRVLVPTLILALLLYNSSPSHLQSKPSITLSLSTYTDSKVMLTNLTSADKSSLFDGTVNYVEKNGASVLSSSDKYIVEGLLNYARQNIEIYRKGLLLAASYNSTHNLTLFNTFAYHSLPVLINTISNIELKLLTKEDASITAINHPVKTLPENCNPMAGIGSAIILFIALSFFSIDLCNYFAIFLSTERIDGFKHIQSMSNVSPVVYWLSNLIFDFIFFFTLVSLRILLYKIVEDSDGPLTFQYSFGILLLLLCGFIIGGLLFTYVVNFLSRSKDGSYTLLSILNIIAVIVALVYYLIHLLYVQSGETVNFPSYFFFFKYLVHLVPMFNYPVSFIKFLAIFLNNAVAIKPVCKGKFYVEKYLVFASKENPNGLLEEIIFMMVDAILYTILLMIIEAGYFNWLTNKVLSLFHGMTTSRCNSETADPDVIRERDFVRAHGSGHSDSDTVLLARGLRKVFLKKVSPFVAVEDVTFAVKARECFGLLGVNGAGKSTCFKMLTGDMLPTEGDASILNTRLSTDRSKYLSKAGYCAQTNGFIEEMTGRETLILIAKLRGVHSNDLKPIVDKWVSILGLEEYQNKKCGGYSGGNKRKLCTAMSLIGDPNIVFLDEPTTGVDPVSRRKLYDVMEHSKSCGQSVVLTSHSMEECENLCDRLTIMSKGNMKCIGTAQNLKQLYAQGFSVFIKMNESLNQETDVITLKNEMGQLFSEELSILKDEHKGLLYYQIQDVRLKWSELFAKMEGLKYRNRVIDDYTITDTSLEEVFLSFARQ